MTKKLSAVDALPGFRRTTTAPPKSHMGDEWDNASGVIKEARRNPDFTRVFNLPRKTEYDWEEVAEELTLELRTEEGDWSIRPIQAEVILSAAQNEGTFASVGVGGGKTLMSFLVGTVSGAEVTVVIVPAKLREKTRRDFEALREKFMCTTRLHIVSAEEIGLKDGLERLKGEHKNDPHPEPDCIVIDECHKFKNKSAARTRKLLRYLKARREINKPCRLVAMSGTITSKSIKDFAHLLEEALGPLNSPLPLDEKELNKWARLVDPNVDSRVNPGPFISRLAKGAYRTAKPDDYRQVIHERIFITPGAVNLPSAAFGGPIEISFIEPTFPSEVIDMLDTLIEGKIQPNGDECYPGDVYRHTRCLCLGFYYDFDPPPPEHWRTARRGWRSYCRQILESDTPGLDSPAMVANAVSRGWYTLPDSDERLTIDDGGALEQWRAVRGDYDEVKHRVIRWVTDEILEEIAKKANFFKEPQLIWTEFAAAGEWLERRGLPYYKNKGMTRDKKHIMDCPGTVSPVLSLAANAEGLNLQDRWNQATYLTPMQSAEMWEQSVGRIHRPGQEADDVQLRVVAGHSKLYEAFDTALDRTRYVQQMQGAPQKLCLADIAR